MKIEMTPKQLLETIKVGVKNGNTDAVVDIIDDALKQLPDDAEFVRATKVEVIHEGLKTS